MFDVVLTESTPVPPLRQRALASLTSILTTQITLILPGIETQRDYIRAKSREEGRKAGRMWKVDLQRADFLLQSLQGMLAHPEAAAASRLDALLHLLDGPLEAVELAPDRLGARVRPRMARGRAVRILLEAETLRRSRVQIEELDPENSIVVQSRGPRCYGEVGQSYISWALNRMDLSTLVMATVAYLRDN
jgi:hypothetical protein